MLLLVMITGWFLLTPADLGAATAKKQYLDGDRAFRQLQNHPEKQKYRDNWLKCIDKYQRIFLDMPQSPWAAAAMYRSAQLFLELHKHSCTTHDKQEAIDLLHRITRRYPQSAYREKAQTLLASLQSSEKSGTTSSGIPTLSSPSDGTDCASQEMKNPVPRKNAIKYKSKTGKTQGSVPLTSSESISFRDAVITDIRHWSNPSYTRVVIDIENERKFTHALLEKNPTLNKPKRLFLDIENSRLGKDLPKQTYINDHLLTQARAGQHTPHSVRVVIDIKSFDNYKVFSLNDPFRVVVDVWAEKSTSPAPSSTTPPPQKQTDDSGTGTLVQQLALGVKTIVIDPGHGGKDPGALGYRSGVQEKSVVLNIARKLAKKMKSQLGCNIILTRSTDKYLPLEGRTAIANTQNADLFISLHCNAAKNKKLAGVETYFLNLATDDEAINVAARENATSRKNISDLESILNDLMKNAKINESGRLSNHVQDAICTGLSKRYKGVHNLGVKQAPFYVLLGATMPSILIETSFISNKVECDRLLDAGYQNHLCDAIVDGVETYIKETSPGKY